MADNYIIHVDNSIEYEQDNQQLADDFLQEYFFRKWDCKYRELDKPQVEFYLTPKCNLGCKYCYLHRYNNTLYPMDNVTSEQILSNVKKVLQWLDKHKWNPAINIFSGEPLAQKLGFDLLQLIYDYEKNVDKQWRISDILIPTNATFIHNDDLTWKIKDYQQKFIELGVEFQTSISIDGLYLEQNRPYKKDIDINLNYPRDETYYNKVFQFASESGAGFHPMVYSKDIHLWKDNFLWFQEQFEKYHISWNHIYLLQVRNEEWTKDQLNEFKHFLDFLWEWTYNKCNKDVEQLWRFLTEARGFNILVENLFDNAYGMPCGIQMEMTLRCDNLSMYPCHRLSYPQFKFGTFVPTEDDDLKFKYDNIELMLSIYGLQHRSLAYCNMCPINHLCVGPCLGSNYETTKQIFVPAPSVCLLQYNLAIGNLKNYIKYGVWQQIYEASPPNRRIQLEYLYNEVNKYV